MSNLLFTISLISLIVCAVNANGKDKKTLLEFEIFKQKFNKTYKSRAQEAHRFAIFKNNLAYINHHNIQALNGTYTFTIGINSFSDLVSWLSFFCMHPI